MRELYEAVAGEVEKVVVGQEQMTATALAALSLGGHVLLEGPPGVAKTLLAAALSRALGLDFRRIQFTPDMLPSDVTGNVALRGGELTFRRGPVFTNVLLADEINRTPPKTQAALLEAMQERQVSVEGRPEPLPDPFLVLATQNPIEYEGTYALPEAQLDRFLVRLRSATRTRRDELRMLGLERRGVGPGDLDHVQPVVGLEALREARAAVDATRVDDEIARYVIAVVRRTRSTCRACSSAPARAPPSTCSARPRRPRASPGRDYVTPGRRRQHGRRRARAPARAHAPRPSSSATRTPTRSRTALGEVPVPR